MPEHSGHFTNRRHQPVAAGDVCHSNAPPHRVSSLANLEFSESAAATSVVDHDRATVERIRSDPDAFALLYQKYATDVYRYCLHRLHDRETAEDVTSQIFLNAYRALPTLGNKPFRPWLFSIAHNAVIDVYRRSQPHTTSLDVFLSWADPADTPEGIAIQRENQDIVRTMVGQLPKRDREVMELRLAGMCGLEIAQVLQCSHCAVRTAYHRAVERMRQLMTVPEAQTG